MNVVETHLDNEGVLTLTLNRPDKLNALNGEVLDNLARHFAGAKRDSQVKAVLLTGQGKAFCAGADINRLAECDALMGYEFAVQGQQVFRALETLGKPSLAAINGYAFGGGCELAISATFRLASTQAQFGQPEVKLGVIPGYGGTQRLARLIGKGLALDLCCTGRFINAETALQYGLVSQVLAPEELLPAAKKMLSTVLSMAPLAIEAVMDVIDRGYDMPLEEALHLEALQFSKVCASDDKNEGVSAFLSKRTAAFKGR